MLVLDSAAHEFSCFWGWLANMPAINRLSSMQWLPRKFENLIGLQLYGSFLFASVSREYLQTKLLYSWWSFVGLRNGAYSLALFCISLASFLQDTQSKRRIYASNMGGHSPSNGCSPPQNQHIPPMRIGNSSFERSNWMGYVSSQEGRYPPNFLEQTPIFDPQSWSQILKGSSGQYVGRPL